MFKKLILIFTVFLFFTKANASIYIVDNYVFISSIEKIKKNRDFVIKEIKQKSLNDFLKSITIKSDFKSLGKIKNYQEYFKLFIVKNEYKKNNKYELLCKIEFDKIKIESFFKKKNIKYIGFKSNPILAIILNKKNDKLDIWPSEKFDLYWGKVSNNLLNIFPPNGDLTDIKLLNNINIRSYQIARLDKIASNYGVRDYIFILFDSDSLNKKENVFVKSQFNELKTSKKYDLADFNQINLNLFFEKVSYDLNNSWKEIQILAPAKVTTLLFDYKLNKLSDYSFIKGIFKKNKNIDTIRDIEITNQLYSGKIIYSGTLEQLKEFFYDEGFVYSRNGSRFYLSKK